MPNRLPDLTELLASVDLSDPEQADQLLSLVYDELRALASAHLRDEGVGHTLQPTALVHEAYMRLAGGAALSVSDRHHFLRIASRAMRRVLLDAARKRNAGKRGAGQVPLTLDSRIVGEEGDSLAVIELHDALERLAELNPEMERLVEMRFFAGMSVLEAAEALGVSKRKAQKDWQFARLWLAKELDA